MSTLNPYAQYQRTAVETASPTKLVVMLYDGAIRFLTKVPAAIQAKNFYEQSMYINKTQAIIAHLYGTLDYEKGGNVAKTLADTYVRMYDMLTAANVHDDADRVEKVLHSLRELREAWVEVDRQMMAQRPADVSVDSAPAREMARSLARAA